MICHNKQNYFYYHVPEFANIFMFLLSFSLNNETNWARKRRREKKKHIERRFKYCFLPCLRPTFKWGRTVVAASRIESLRVISYCTADFLERFPTIRVKSRTRTYVKVRHHAKVISKKEMSGNVFYYEYMSFILNGELEISFQILTTG